MGGTDVCTDSGDTICRPIENGGGIKTEFQEGSHGGHLGFPFGTILAIFDPEVTLMLPTKIQVNWPFGSREEAKNGFSRWQPRQPF